MDAKPAITSIPPCQAIDCRAPRLSLLIPAYEFPEGVTRILDRIPRDSSNIEVLIADDSTSNDVRDAVFRHPLHQCGQAIYRKNMPPLGPAGNWNSLILTSRGQFLQFMHHDECPSNMDYFKKMLLELETKPETHIAVMACLLPSGQHAWRRHFPRRIQNLLLRFWPEHLLRHNTWGSPSVVVVSRDRVATFDPALKWLIDVDWYHQMLLRKGTSVRFSDLEIHSIPRHEQSITASLSKNIPALRQSEAAHISRRDGSSIALWLQGGATHAAKLMGQLEMGLWLVLKIGVRVYSEARTGLHKTHLQRE